VPGLLALLGAQLKQAAEEGEGRAAGAAGQVALHGAEGTLDAAPPPGSPSSGGKQWAFWPAAPGMLGAPACREREEGMCF